LAEGFCGPGTAGLVAFLAYLEILIIRYSLNAAGLLFASFFAVGISLAEEIPEEVHAVAVPAAIVITPELVEAHHAYQLAQLRLQQYRFVELPRERRLLDDQVRLAESEIRVLKSRVRDHRPFLQVGQYSPVRILAENDRLALQATQQLLRQVKDERINLMRYSHQNSQLYQLDVLRTVARVRQVMAQARKESHEKR